jgi:beta-glucanase (GH16 family)
MVSEGALFDDFDGPAGAPPDQAIWDYNLFSGRPPELQTYTSAPENVSLDGEGHLVLAAQQTPAGYTSAEIVTRGKAQFLYGTVSARIQFPSGQGLLPQFWLLGADYAELGWPQCGQTDTMGKLCWPDTGEIDIMEAPNDGIAYQSTLHGPTVPPQPQGWQAAVKAKNLTPIPSTDGFHDYWVHRTVDHIEFGIDGLITKVFTPENLPPGAQWVFNKPMYAVFDVAVGNEWTGPPDGSTPFPAVMLVDSFRYTPE